METLNFSWYECNGRFIRPVPVRIFRDGDNEIAGIQHQNVRYYRHPGAGFFFDGSTLAGFFEKGQGNSIFVSFEKSQLLEGQKRHGGYRPGSGRPDLDIKRSLNKAVRFSPGDWERIKFAAAMVGKKPSEYLRWCALARAQQLGV